MYVGALRVEFALRGARSLKDKRKPLRSLRDRVRSKFNSSFAEVGLQDTRQRVLVGLALVDATEARLRERLAAVRRYLERDPELRYVSAVEHIFEPLDESLGFAAFDAEGIETPPPDLLYMDTDGDEDD
jgi:uncharacterized protein